MILTTTCSNCGYPLPFDSDGLSVKISIPEDREICMRFLTGALNNVECRICGTTTILRMPLLFYCVQTKEITQYLVAGFETLVEEATKAIGLEYKEQFDVYSTTDIVAYYDAVLRLIEKYLNPNLDFLQKILKDPKLINAVSRTEYIRQVNPFLLRFLMHYQKFPVLFLHIKIGFLIDEAAMAGQFHGLMEIYQKEIPKVCLTDAVLAEAAGQSLQFTDPLEDKDKFVTSWRAQFGNAILHLYSGKPNPNVKIWANQFLTIQLLARSPEYQIDQAFMLSPELVKATIPFHVLWGVLVPLLNNPASSDFFSFAVDLLYKNGYENEFGILLDRGMFSFKFSPSVTDEERGEMASRYFELLIDLPAKLGLESVSPDRLIGHGSTVILKELLESGLTEAALFLIEKFFRRFREEGRVDALGSVASKAIEQLNDYQCWSQSRELIDEIRSVDGLIEKMAPGTRYILFNEIGNTCRYLERYTSALQYYDQCESILAPLKDKSETYQHHYRVLLRNKAIVFRHLGKFTRSLEYFEQVRSFFLEDAEFHNNLAVTYLELNLLDDAMAHINRALGLSGGKSSQRSLLNYGIIRAIIYFRLKEFERGMADLEYVMRHPPVNPDIRPDAAVGLLLHFPPMDLPVFTLAVGIAQEIIQRKPAHERYLFGSYFTLIRYQMKAGRIDSANRLFGECLERMGLEKVNSGEWNVFYIRSLLAFENGEFDTCWLLLLECMKMLKKDLLQDEQRSFSDSYQFDKDEFKRSLASMGVALYRSNFISPRDLIEIYEFNNGLEISVRLSEAPGQFEPLYGLFFLDYDDKVAVIGVTPEADPFVLHDVEFSQEAIFQSKLTFQRQMKGVNPADPEDLDEEIRHVFTLLVPLYNAILRYLPGDEPICFFPGNIFSNYPLHLVRSGRGEYLFTERCLFYCPNLHIYDSERRTGKTAERLLGLVTVSKWGDTASFVDRMEGIVDHLRGNSSDLIHCREEGATLEMLLPVIEKVDELVFLCHGAFAGPTYGNVICVYGEAGPPPGFLPITNNESLKRFLLTWKDINQLSVTPEVVVSIACSSARVIIKEAGVRYGLEQALFSLGTKTIISPQWDIQQSAALDFIRLFYDIRAHHRDMPLHRAYHRTLLEMHKKYHHIYFWGGITYNGKISNSHLWKVHL